MKKNIFITSLLITTFTILSFSPNPPTERQKHSVKAIIDSFKVLRQLNAFADGYSNPPTAEELRHRKIVTMLFDLPLAETRKLMADASPSVRIYGMLVACKKYYKELAPKDLEIFNDRSKVMLYTQEGNIEAPFDVGTFAKMMYDAMPEELALHEKENTAKDSLSAFIRRYAAYPASYAPIGSNVSVRDMEDDNGPTFVLEHHYNIIHKDGKKVTDTAFFTLNKEYIVKDISKEEPTSFSPTYYYGDWLSNIGRKLDNADSIRLHVK